MCANVKIALFVENFTVCKINVTVDKVFGANYNKTKLGGWQSAGKFFTAEKFVFLNKQVEKQSKISTIKFNRVMADVLLFGRN